MWSSCGTCDDETCTDSDFDSKCDVMCVVPVSVDYLGTPLCSVGLSVSAGVNAADVCIHMICDGHVMVAPRT